MFFSIELGKPVRKYACQ